MKTTVFQVSEGYCLRPRLHVGAPLVSSAVMDETWRAMGEWTTAAVRRMQKRCGEDQEELTGFVLAFTSNLRPEALGLALYVHLVVAQAFRRSGVKFRKITPEGIEREWEENFAFINELKTAGYGCSHFFLPTHLSSEPAVVQYVIDALTVEDDADPVVLGEAEFWRILQVLKTFADCMHAAAAANIKAA